MNKTIKITGLIYLIYLIFDSIHFIIFRIQPNYLPLQEGYYENWILSVIKWSFCTLILVALYLNVKNKKASFYIILTSIIGVLLLFILKGQWNNFIMGSFVFKIGLLEFGALSTIIFLIKKLKVKYEINIWILLAFITLTTIFLSVIFYNIRIF